MPPVARYAGYIFDIDGTLQRGGRLLPGANGLLTQLRAEERRVAVMSNNPLVTAATHAHRLVDLGLDVRLGEVLTSVTALLDRLRADPPAGAVYVIGEPPLVEAVRAAGVPVSDDPAEIGCVVAAFDRTFDYHKWTIGFRAMRAGADLIATNPDATYPTADGEIPDCAGIIAALEASTGRRASAVLGKPSGDFLHAVLRHLDVPKSDVLIVGDRLSTDIAMGANHGVDTALVMTGVTTEADLATSSVTPTYVLPHVGALGAEQSPIRTGPGEEGGT